MRRAKSDLILMYKMFHSLVDIPIERFFVRRNSNHNMRFHHPYTIQSKVRSKCRVMQDSYFNRVVNVWNNLPDISVLSKSLPVFRSHLDMIGESQLLPNRKTLLRNDTRENCQMVDCKCRAPYPPLSTY